MGTLELVSMLQQARNAVDRRDFGTAGGLCHEVLKQRRNDVRALMLLAEMALLAEDLPRELEYTIRAVKATPREPALRDHLGKCYAFRGDYGKALVQFEKALKLDPAFVPAIAGTAHVFERQNRYDKARRLLEPLARRPDPSPLVAFLYMRVLLHDGEPEAAITLGQTVLAAGHDADLHLRGTCFQLAKAYERTGDYDQAFATAARANAMLPCGYDPDPLDAETDLLVETFTAERLDALPRPAEPAETPVFIVGVPRCGSTLVERILASHPRIHGAGEIRAMMTLVNGMSARIGSTLAYPECTADLDANDVELLSRSYLDAIVPLAPRADRIVNKDLGNHRHLGLIAVLFPNARIIHCRRDPLDTCLSCFMEPFPPHTSMFTSDLVHIGRYHRAYERLMRHWSAVLDLAFLDVEYEALVKDQGREIRRLVDFCGVPWHDACLRFHETKRHERTLSFDQVRRPMYDSSIGRAARFGRNLDPLRRALAEDAEGR